MYKTNENSVPQDLEKWLKKELDESGIKSYYLRTQFATVNDLKYIANRLNWKAWIGSGGWYTYGSNPDGTENHDCFQFKPQVAPIDQKTGKPIKYILPKDKPAYAYFPLGQLENYVDFIRRHTEQISTIASQDERVWKVPIFKFIATHNEFPILITEGVKKCMAGWQVGIPSLSVAGVNNWHEKGDKNRLRPELHALFHEGRDVFLAFDADFTTNHKVWEALIGLAKLLDQRGCRVRICYWDIAQGKGMDDFIVRGGDFDAVVNTALTIAQWESKFSNPPGKVIEMAPYQQKQSVREAIAATLEDAADEVDYEIRKVRVCGEFKVSPQQFDKIAEKLEPPDFEEVQEEIQSLLRASYEEIDLADFLPETLAKPISQLAQWMYLRPATFLFSLLATTGAMCRNGTFIRLLRETNHLVTPNLFVGIVAESSQKKTPLLKAIAGNPLIKMNIEAEEAYKSNLKEWKRLYRDKENDPDTPPEPTQKVHMFTKTTGEALLRQVNRRKEVGLMWLCDELPGIFKSMNQYRSGRGSDKEDLLSYYNGTGGQTLRGEGMRDNVETFNLSILGGIQPAILHQYLGNCEDPAGEWARFLLVEQPEIASIISPEPGGTINIESLLKWLYKEIHKLSEQIYDLSPDARRQYAKIQNYCERKRVDPLTRPILKKIWGKLPERIGKIAINLHLIEGLCRTEIPADLIAVETLQRAIQLSLFSFRQIEKIYIQAQGGGKNLSNQALGILEFAKKREGAIAPSDVKRFGDRAQRKMTLTEIKTLFRHLAHMGYGGLEESNRTIRLRVEDSFAQFRTVSHAVSHGETQLEQGFEPNSHSFARLNSNLEEEPKEPENQENSEPVESKVTKSRVGTVPPTTPQAQTPTARTDSLKIGDRVGFALWHDAEANVAGRQPQRINYHGVIFEVGKDKVYVTPKGKFDGDLPPAKGNVSHSMD